MVEGDFETVDDAPAEDELVTEKDEDRWYGREVDNLHGSENGALTTRPSASSQFSTPSGVPRKPLSWFVGRAEWPVNPVSRRAEPEN